MIIQQMTLLQRVKKCKQQMGISYKNISIKCNIPYATFYSFTGGVRKLPEQYINTLDQYLQKLGY